MKIPFAIIDEDKNNIVTLKKLIAKLIPNSLVFATDDGLNAWEFIRKQKIPMVILCDYNAANLNGKMILQKVRNFPLVSKSHLILLMPRTFNKEDLFKLLNIGLDDFITKPLQIDQLFTKLRISANSINKELIINEKNKEILSLNDEIKRSSKQLRDVVTKIQQHRFTDKADIFSKLNEASQWILRALDEQTDSNIKDEIESAAAMIYIGKLFLPDKNINDAVMVSGFVKNEKMEQVPKFAKELIEGVKGLENIALILYHLYENFDGSGIPDKIQSWEIPLGSRILRVVLEYTELMAAGKKNSAKIIEGLDHESKRLYDFRIVTLLDQYLAYSGSDYGRDTEKPIELKRLKPGQILTRNIITSSGIKLMSSGTVLKDENIIKIKGIVDSDPIIGTIWIK